MMHKICSHSLGCGADIHEQEAPLGISGSCCPNTSLRIRCDSPTCVIGQVVNAGGHQRSAMNAGKQRLSG
jgi:hypothetical protein